MLVRPLPYVISRSVYYGLFSLIFLTISGIAYIISDHRIFGIVAAISSVLFVMCAVVAGMGLLTVLVVARWRNNT